MINIAYGFPETEIIACPFCFKEMAVLYVPSVRREKKASWGGQAAMVKTRTEEYIVQKPCPSCGKTVEEIQKALNKDVSERNRYESGGAFQKYSFKKGNLNKNK